MNTIRIPKALVGFVALLFAVPAYVLFMDQVKPTIPAEDRLPARIIPATEPPSQPALPNFKAIVAQNGPSVVNVSISGSTKVSNSNGPPTDPDVGNPDSNRRFQSLGQVPSHLSGSGFIVRPDGVIITNAHVVDGASEVTVKLTDKREFKAKLLGIDKPTDTAVLKIDAENLPTVRLGDPAQMGVGDWVLAIGSPFGFENSVTAGIVSAKSRTLPDEGYVPFIQTDVALNPGNSGGPLFNLNGEVIGINAQIYSSNGGYQGLSFAVPIDVAIKVEQQILRNGKVSRGRIGFSVQEVDQALADSFGLEKPVGALIASVANDGPAAKAGIKAGDILFELDGKAVQEPAELGPLVADLKPGSQATLVVWRNEKAETIMMRVGDGSETEQAVAASAELSESRLGLALHPLTTDDPGQAKHPAALVVEQSSGPSAQAGIEPGDVLLSVNGHPVIDTKQLRALVDKAHEHVALLIQRGNDTRFVPVDLD